MADTDNLVFDFISGLWYDPEIIKDLEREYNTLVDSIFQMSRKVPTLEGDPLNIPLYKISMVDGVENVYHLSCYKMKRDKHGVVKISELKSVLNHRAVQTSDKNRDNNYREILSLIQYGPGHSYSYYDMPSRWGDDIKHNHIVKFPKPNGKVEEMKCSADSVFHHLAVKNGSSVGKGVYQPSELIRLDLTSPTSYKNPRNVAAIVELLSMVAISSREHATFHRHYTNFSITSYSKELLPWALQSEENFNIVLTTLYEKFNYNLGISYNSFIDSLKVDDGRGFDQ